MPTFNELPMRNNPDPEDRMLMFDPLDNITYTTPLSNVVETLIGEIKGLREELAAIKKGLEWRI